MNAPKQIPIIRIPFDASDHAWLQQNWQQVLQGGNLTMGKYTEEFERRFAEFCGVRFAAAASSGTSALELILRAVGVEKSSVIVPTNTFLATALAVIHAGAKVIFSDSCEDDFCLDPKDVERRIRPDTKAVLLVHIGGLISKRMDALLDLCKRRNLVLLEDGAHAHGCSWNGKMAGSIGRAGAFSFFPTKVLTCGEGGMVTTNDEALYRQVLMLRNHGKNPALKNQISELGYNWRLSELTAVLGVQQMNRAKELIEKRQWIARTYEQLLAGWNSIEIVRPAPGVVSSYYKFIVYLKKTAPKTIKDVMKKQFSVSLTGEVYADLCHEQPLFTRQPRLAENSTDSFPGAERIARRHICLPLYPDLTRDEIHYVVDSLRQTIEQQEREPLAVPSA